MKNLLNKKYIKTVLLIFVAVISVFSSVYIYAKNSNSSSTINQIKKTFVPVKIESLKVELEYNLESNYVDVYLSSANSMVSLIELVFKTNGNTKLVGLQNADLFADYLKTATSDSFRVAGTGGPEANLTKVDNRVLFARLQMENLTDKNSLSLDLQNSQAITKDDTLIKLVY